MNYTKNGEKQALLHFFRKVKGTKDIYYINGAKHRQEISIILVNGESKILK